MPFKPVYVYDGEGNFLGATIYQDGSKKLHTANLWQEEDHADLKAQLDRLHDNTDVRAFWPNVQDPDVQAILAQEDFEPVGTSPVTVVDEDASFFVWIEEPTDENPYGRMDEEASNLVYKTVDAPNPTDVKSRIMKACEIVARARAEEAANQG
jgi:hypothetical protein